MVNCLGGDFLTKIMINDVLYTVSNETFYVLNRTNENAPKYYAETLGDVVDKIKQDEWKKCGKLNRSNGLLADLFEKDGNYIAVWEE